ncbi:hypothetical protein WK78_22020 [Burkholderia cepacia]|nr:hypothetical protein WK78_22020 [Burkholderia cepacia]OQD21308.1 hypothetical protein UE98_20625 [Burkholderia cenocepacia]
MTTDVLKLGQTFREARQAVREDDRVFGTQRAALYRAQRVSIGNKVGSQVRWGMGRALTTDADATTH